MTTPFKKIHSSFSFIKKVFFYVTGLLILGTLQSYAQGGGLAVTPTKVFFELGAGESRSAKIMVTNQSSKRQLFEVSFSDWERDSLGNKIYLPDNNSPNSCSRWLVVSPALFELEPNESKELTVVINCPPDSSDVAEKENSKVRWSMLFIKQTAEKNSIEESSKVLESKMIIEFRVGVHIYYTPTGSHTKNIDILSFREDKVNNKKRLAVKLVNTGDIIGDGEVHLELVNTRTGEEFKEKPISMSIFPQMSRVVFLPLPEGLPKGTYSAGAIVDTGADYELKIAELELKLE
jgi:P pilus assembly chaperone PapD